MSAHMQGKGSRWVGVLVAGCTLAAGTTLVRSGIAQASPQPATAWYAGAAAVSVTAPRFNAADDAVEFPLCNTTYYNGPRAFDFEEPYRDVMGTGQFQYPDPWCDANLNGRYDGLYTSGGIARLMTWVQSDVWARALAVSDGTRTVVIESITSQGLGSSDTARVRSALDGYTGAAGHGPVGAVFVSSTHNESSPDPIGIYGAPADPSGTVGLHSGIDDYYITFLVNQAVKAGKQAVDALRVARMRVGELTPPDVRARLSTTFLTTDSNPGVTSGPAANGTPEATDTKGLVLQLVDASTGANIETLFNWAAHNQQTGHAPGDSVAPDPNDGNALRPINQAFSDDWPGVFAQTVESAAGGHAMFLVGTNGTIEDPHAYPLPNPDNECPGTDFNPPRAHGTSEGCVTLPRATGTRLANDVLNIVGASPALGLMQDVTPHALSWATQQFAAPLQNQLFIAAFGAGLFAHRTAADVTPCVDSKGVARTCFQTVVSVLDLGPQLQLLTNPGEAYPALIEGNPFGQNEASCPERTEPPTPAWHASAAHHIEMGLGDDMLGYEIPAWGWFADSGVYADPSCPAGSQATSNPTADYDQHGNYHKLESESVGPDVGNLVAQHVSGLLDCDAAGTLAACSNTSGAVCATGVRTIEPGRFLLADGSFTRRGRDGPVGMWVLPCGTTAFAPGTGTLVALPGFDSFGGAAVTLHGVFMDFDGHPQSAPDIDTRGMLVINRDGSVIRYFVDPYPVLTGASPGAATSAPAAPELPAGGAALLVVAFLAGTLALRRRAFGRVSA